MTTTSNAPFALRWGILCTKIS
jgi:predicted dehydrogenase